MAGWMKTKNWNTPSNTLIFISAWLFLKLSNSTDNKSEDEEAIVDQDFNDLQEDQSNSLPLTPQKSQEHSPVNSPNADYGTVS